MEECYIYLFIINKLYDIIQKKVLGEVLWGK
jgi:hypothetical protein